MSIEIVLLSLTALIIVGTMVFGGLAVFLAMKGARPPEPDEHEVMVRPRDKQGRWVKEGDGIVVPKGPGAPWQRGKK